MRLPPNPIAVFVPASLPNHVRDFLSILHGVESFLFSVGIFHNEVSRDFQAIAGDIGSVHRQLFRLFFDGLRFIDNPVARIGGAFLFGLFGLAHTTSSRFKTAKN